MRRLFLVSLAFFGVFLFGPSAQAQAKFAGRYRSVAGYVSGEMAGNFGYGTTTVFRNGNVTFSEYWPALGEEFSGTGRVTRNGRITFDGATGGGVIFNSRFAFGSFSDEGGDGYFAMSK